MGQVLRFPLERRRAVHTFGAYAQLTETRIRVYLFGRFVDLDFQLPSNQGLCIVQVDRYWTLDDDTVPNEHHYIELASLLLQFAASHNRILKLVRI